MIETKKTIIIITPEELATLNEYGRILSNDTTIEILVRV